MAMTRLSKIMKTACAASLTALGTPSVSHGNSIPNKLTVYAGPQSVTPDTTIYVTVEAGQAGGESALETEVELSFNTDKGTKTLTGKTRQGLVSFEVPPRKKAGIMTFTAKAAGTSGNNARVLVIAAAPQAFSLTTQPAEPAGRIKIRTSVITDKYGNRISGLSSVTLDWIDSSGLRARQAAQPKDGKIALTLACPQTFKGALTLRASLQTLQVSSRNISHLCLGQDG